MTSPLAHIEQAAQHLRAAVELIDLDDGGHVPEYYATLYQQLADLEAVSAMGRQLATDRFVELVDDGDSVPLGGGKAAIHKRGRVGDRQPDNDAFAGDLRRHLMDRFAALDPGTVAAVLDGVSSVISFNVSNAKATGCRDLGMDKSEYYGEAGHYESRLVIY